MKNDPKTQSNVMRSIVLAMLICPSAAAIADESLDTTKIPQFVKKLDHDDPQVQAAAVEELRKFGPEAKAAVPSLVKMLADNGKFRSIIGDRPLYDQAFRCLIEIGSESVDSLTAALGDSSPDVRRRSAEALGRIGRKAKPSLPALLKACKDGDSDVRCIAVQALPIIDLSGDESLSVLSDRLRDDDRMVRNAAVVSLAAFRNHRKATVPRLLEMLNDRAPQVRGNAALALGNLGGNPTLVVPALLPLLADKTSYYDYSISPGCVLCTDRSVARDAAHALGKFESGAALAGPGLISSLKESTRWSFNHEAACALGKLGSTAKPLTPKIIEVAQTPELFPGKRASTLLILRDLGQNAEEAVPELLKLMELPPKEDDADAMVQVAAACALVSIDFAGNGPAWRRLLAEMDRLQSKLKLDHEADEHDWNATMIFETLGNLGPKASEAVPRLSQLLDASHSGDKIIVCLGRIGPAAGETIPLMIEKTWWSWEFDWRSAALQGIGTDAIPFIVDTLVEFIEEEENSIDVEKCVGLVNTLGMFGDQGRTAIPVLVRLSHDKHRDVRAAACKNLGLIHSSPMTVVPELLQRLGDERPVVREQAVLALAAFHEKAIRAVPPLVEAMKDEFIDVRAAAAEALGEIGASEQHARQALNAALNDSSQLVRAAARRALLQL